MDIGFGKKKDKKGGGVDASGSGDLRGKMRKMEQNLDSLNRRLDAIERRLSEEGFEGTTVMNDQGHPSQNVEKRVHQLSQKMDSEITQLQQELQEIKKGHAGPSPKDTSQNQRSGSPTVLKAGKQKGSTSDGKAGNINSGALADLERRMEELEGRKATVKVGRIEVPVEITGIVGGVLAFLIAALLVQGYRELIISPAFVVFLGVVLVAAAAFKTYLINLARR